MDYILVALGFAIAFGIIYWIDKKNRAERTEAEKIYRLIFAVFDKIDWGMPIERVMENFRDKEFVTTEDFGEITGTGYLDRIDEREILVSFFFPKEGEKKLIRTDFYLLSLPSEKYNALFSYLNDRHSLAAIDGDDSAVWNLESAILRFDTSKDNEAQLQFWNREFYYSSLGGAESDDVETEGEKP